MFVKHLKLFAPLALLLLSACAVRQAQTYDSYGNPAYSLTCDIAERQECIKQAYKTCPHGYYLVDEDDSGFAFNSILIRCKD
jgi:hypothetical protein